ncbi:hypothetical protein [Veillonella magna]|uniref:Uncharacterized protein n=1 Tax=Veillonella magna TaxID=464322 RepID=A0ABS2GEI5_9FIRM|nr:hypothetical protein [Veillonella magna]MBM6823509.1 hypothetical protein [Veillonella magna]MBM6911853.1 hypothetical protein [Veillonella magna]
MDSNIIFITILFIYSSIRATYIIHKTNKMLSKEEAMRYKKKSAAQDLVIYIGVGIIYSLIEILYK